MSGLLVLALTMQSCHYFRAPPREVIVEEEKPNPYPDDGSEDPWFCPEDFESRLIDLYELQSILFSDVIVAMINDLDPEIIENSWKNLYGNVHEIGALFMNVYGSPVASRIKTLWDQQVALFIEYLIAVRCGDQPRAKSLLIRSYANGHLIVELLNIMNPYFPYQPEKYLMDEHVMLQSDQALAYLKGDTERAEELMGRSVAQSREMALHLSKAMQKQLTICY